MRFSVNIDSFKYPDGSKALANISLEVKKGEFIGILGSNGSGKTTFLKVVDGLLRDFKGTILLDGNDIKKLSPKQIYKKVGLVFQNPDDQLFAPTVFEDMAFGPRNMGFPEKEVVSRVNAALKDVEMEGYGTKSIHNLSFGQKKRICIAGLLAMGHEILLLDEPTAGLDPMGEHKMMDLLTRLNKEKAVTILMATHNVDLVPVFLDRLLILSKGQVVRSGVPEEVFTAPENMTDIKLRLPQIAELIYQLKHEDHMPFGKVPLTIGEARREILKMWERKTFGKEIHSLRNFSGNEAVLVIGHGSPDPESNQEFLNFVQRFRDYNGFRKMNVSGAFLELAEPSIPQGLKQLKESGATQIYVIPYFLFRANHVKCEVPGFLAEFQKDHPEVKLIYGRSLWPHKNLIELTEKRIEETFSLFPEEVKNKTDVLVVGRGASDSEAINQFLEAMDSLRKKIRCRSFRHSFIAIAQPAYAQVLPEMLHSGTERLIVFPFYLFTGVLVKRIATMVAEAEKEHTASRIKVVSHFGNHPLMLEMLQEIVEECIKKNADGEKT